MTFPPEAYRHPRAGSAACMASTVAPELAWPAVCTRPTDHRGDHVDTYSPTTIPVSVHEAEGGGWRSPSELESMVSPIYHRWPAT